MVNKERRKELGESAMCIPELDFAKPINFVCKNCLDSSGITDEIPNRKAPSKTTVEDLTVNDVIVCPNPLRRKILRRFKDPGRKVQVYKLVLIRRKI